MGKEILNRRQNIYAENIPPEITDTSGFIEATDYATGTTGGTIKVDGTYQVELTSGGKIKAKEVAAADYASANDASFISKGTLDNLIAAGTLGGSAVDILFDCEGTPVDLVVDTELETDFDPLDYHFIAIGLKVGVDGHPVCVVGSPDPIGNAMILLHFDPYTQKGFCAKGFTVSHTGVTCVFSTENTACKWEEIYGIK